MQNNIQIKGGHLRLVYLQCYFVTIATILGTGILGLPVTLSQAGLYPFLVSFLGGFIIQALLIVFFADLLQRSHAAQLQNVDVVTAEHMPLNNLDLDDDFQDADDELEHSAKTRELDNLPPDLFINANSIINPNYVEAPRRASGELAGPVTSDVMTSEEAMTSEVRLRPASSADSQDSEKEDPGPVLAGHVILPRETAVRAPNLHLLGELFLWPGVRQLFDIVLLVQFIALLTSYALAGSEAYAEVIGIPHVYVIPVFVWILTLAVVFALAIIQPIVSLLTFLKGSLLLATVIVTFIVGTTIHQEIHNDFAFMGAPFLMGTVALGGVINVMPFLYAKISPVASQVRCFRNAILGGLITCAILNVLWCWAVLDIVPQLDACVHDVIMHDVTYSHNGSVAKALQQHCTHNYSLQWAAREGEISTVPMTKIIEELYPTFNWVALLVELFIMISITVSFLTMGAAMHHTLGGLVESLFNKDTVSTYAAKVPVPQKLTFCTCKSISRCLLSLTMFSAVFAIAMCNPKGFVTVLEKVSSLFINLEAGLFVFIMIARATHGKNRRLQIPLPLPGCLYHTQYLLPLYFGLAVFYDIYLTIHDQLLRGHLSRYPGVPASPGNGSDVTDSLAAALNITYHNGTR